MKAADATEETEEAQALSLGWIVGGATAANKAWDDVIGDLTSRIGKAAVGIEVPLNLNVVFQVPGNMLKPEFVGVRTGRFSKSRALLMVQAAVPEEMPSDPISDLKNMVHAAIDEADRWARKRKVPIDVSKLLDILGRA